jgi:hypothetical protein
MKSLGGILAAACAGLSCALAGAQAVVDGTYAGDSGVYGAALSIQNTNTQYGNATNGDPRYANGGSEIDQVFAAVDGDRLFVLITGNLESNFNKLEVFIDSVPGGVNQLVGANLPEHVDPYCCGDPNNPNAALQAMSGLRFDAGFDADRYLTFSNGNHTYGNPAISRWTLSAYYAELDAGTTGHKSDVGFQWNPYGAEPGLAQGEPIDQLNNGCDGPTDTNCTPPEHEFAEPIDIMNDPTNTRGHRDLLNDIGLLMAINNSNTGGVNSGSGAETGTPENVLTGIEFSLPLAVLGHPTGPIKIAAFVNNGPHTFLSNQFAGVGILAGNRGNPSTVNLATIADDQFVTVPHIGLDGDFNNDGTVDAVDYTVWRNGLGGFYDAEDYDVWKAHYGDALAGAGGVALPEAGSVVVPEPGILALCLTATSLKRRSRRTGRDRKR